MGILKVREYFKNFNIEHRIQELELSSATVELAAKALGCEEKKLQNHYLLELMKMQSWSSVQEIQKLIILNLNHFLKPKPKCYTQTKLNP